MKKLIFSILVLCHSTSFAFLQFNNISDDDFKSVSKEFTANFSHLSVSGANTLGSIFGFEVGLIGGITSTPDTKRIVQSSGGSSIGEIPNGVLYGALTIPMGVTFEANLMPSIEVAGVRSNVFSGAVKWTLTETLLPYVPLSLAAKFAYTHSSLDGDTVVNGNQTSLHFTDDATNLSLLASKDLFFVEPYVSVGLVSAHTNLKTDYGSVFINGSNSNSANIAGTAVLLGGEFKFILFKMGLEYGNILGASRYNLKLAFKF